MARIGAIVSLAVLAAAPLAAPRAAEITVTFQELKVADDCDSVGAGEFYYSFKVGGLQTLFVDREKAVSVGSGESILLKGSRTLTRLEEAGQAVEVSGTVSEVDEVGKSDHVAGEFTHRYSYDSGWNPGPKVTRLTGGGCDATLYYDVAVRE